MVVYNDPVSHVMLFIDMMECWLTGVWMNLRCSWQSWLVVVVCLRTILAWCVKLIMQIEGD